MDYLIIRLFVVALDLAVYLEKAISGFSRYHKYSLGADLRRIARHNISLIVRANSEINRFETLLLLRNSLKELMVGLRIIKELQMVKSLQGFIYAVEKVVQLSRQNEVWIKSLNELPEQQLAKK